MTSAADTDGLAPAALALAHCFHRGATLWCWSPSCPPHAAHVAVEFVHPVVVGARSVPAVAVGDRDPGGYLRAGARPGDVIVAIGRGDEQVLVDVVARAPAWGVLVVWLAHGERPPSESGAQVVWLGADAEAADVVCAYHLLWELTHVCLERPGLLEMPDDTPSCPVCADAGDLGEIDAVPVDDGYHATAIVAGVRQSVDLSLVGPCERGELVVVHAGVAIAKLAGAARG